MDSQRRGYGWQPPVDWRSAGSEGELSDSDDEWGSDESSCSTCSSGSYDDYRWSMASEAISGGELFYIECKAQNLILAQRMKQKLQQPGTKTSAKSKGWKKGAHGTLARLMKHGRKKIKIPSKSKTDQEDPPAGEFAPQRRLSNSSVDQSTGEIIEVKLLVENRRPNLGRRATSIEILFGIVGGNFSLAGNDDRIMVAGFIPDMPASLSKKMKIGDWLQSIDGNQVFHSNIDTLIATISPNSIVTLRLRRVEQSLNVHASPYLISKGFEVDHLLQIMCKGAAASCKGCLMILDEGDEVLYNYPAGGPLQEARGLFLTLAHFFKDTFDLSPSSTQITMDGVQYLVMYLNVESHIMLLAIPAERDAELEAVELFNKFVETIRFMYQSFIRVTSEFQTRFDLLVDSLFTQLQTHEHLLFHTHVEALQNKIQNDLDNALSQLEAEPTNESSNGIYYVLGSCIYYKNICLRSHLPEGILGLVTSYLWIHNVLSLEQAGLPLERLLAWKEVYLPEKPFVDPDAFEEPPGRYYILLLGQKQMLVGVLIKSDIPLEGKEDEMLKPLVSYIEQVQEVLDNMQLMGMPSILDSILDSKATDHGSTSDQWSINSDKSYFNRSNSTEGMKKSPIRSGSQLSVNSKGDNHSETSSEASWNSSEFSSQSKLTRYKNPSRTGIESFGRGLQLLLTTSGDESIVLMRASLKDGLDKHVDTARLKIANILCQSGRVLGAVGEVGIIFASREKKSEETCFISGKRVAPEISEGHRVTYICSEDVGVNFDALLNRLAFTCFLKPFV